MTAATCSEKSADFVVSPVREKTGRNILPVIREAIDHLHSKSFRFGWDGHEALPMRDDVDEFMRDLERMQVVTKTPAPDVRLDPSTGTLLLVFAYGKKAVNVRVFCANAVKIRRVFGDGQTSIESLHCNVNDCFHGIQTSLAWLTK